MQVKTTILILVVGLVAGSVGWLIGSSSRSTKDDTPVRSADAHAPYREAELTANLLARDAEIFELRQRLGVRESGEAETQPDSTTASTREASGAHVATLTLDNSEKPFDHDRARTAALDLGVSEDSLRIAIKAYDCVRNNADPEVQAEALRVLADLGEERARAVAAMLRGVEHGELGGRPVRKLLQVAHVEGQERLFIDLLKDGVTSASTKAEVIRHFDVFDSEAGRDYLLERFRREENRYSAAGIVMTLGKMKEARAVPLIRETLDKGGDWAVFDLYSLLALGSIGGREAEAVLLDYLRRDKLTHVDRAISALARIDPDRARAEAQAILNRADVSRLPASTLETLRQHAG